MHGSCSARLILKERKCRVAHTALQSCQTNCAPMVIIAGSQIKIRCRGDTLAGYEQVMAKHLLSSRQVVKSIECIDRRSNKRPAE